MLPEQNGENSNILLIGTRYGEVMLGEVLGSVLGIYLLILSTN